MLRHFSPNTVPSPLANYSHAVEITVNSRIVLCSGQLGADAEGDIPADTRTQADVCFDNIEKILADAGMTLADVVRINAFVTDRAHMAPYMEARDARFHGQPPASTLMIVSGFTREEFNVEIEVIAARDQ